MFYLCIHTILWSVRQFVMRLRLLGEWLQAVTYRLPPVYAYRPTKRKCYKYRYHPHVHRLFFESIEQLTFNRPSRLAAPPKLILEMNTPSSYLFSGLPRCPLSPPLICIPSRSFGSRTIVSSYVRTMIFRWLIRSSLVIITRQKLTYFQSFGQGIVLNL